MHINPDVTAFLQSLLIVAITAVLGALATMLLSPKTQAAVKAFADRMAAETQHILSSSALSNNMLLKTLVISAMHYAENHSDEVEKAFDSKAEYVIHIVAADPRFGAMGVPLENVKQLIEEAYTEYFSQLQKPASTQPQVTTNLVSK